jgi:hypothetical protein
MTLAILGLLTITVATAAPATIPCYCVGPPVEKSLQRAASVFMGQVVEVSGPRSVSVGEAVQKFYVTKFSVWDQWKGNRAPEVEVLTELHEDSCVAYPRMTVGERYLVFANPITVKADSPNIQGIVTTCTLTTRVSGPGPEYELTNGHALATMFDLDKLTKAAPPKRIPAFGLQPIGKGFCLICDP